MTRSVRVVPRFTFGVCVALAPLLGACAKKAADEGDE